MRIIIITLLFVSYASAQSKPNIEISSVEVELSKFKISPNPVISDVLLSIPEINGKVLIEVYDVIGDIIYRKETVIRDYYINTDNWSNGSYIVRLSQGDVSVIKRLVKQ